MIGKIIATGKALSHSGKPQPAQGFYEYLHFGMRHFA